MYSVFFGNVGVAATWPPAQQKNRTGSVTWPQVGADWPNAALPALRVGEAGDGEVSRDRRDA